MSRKRQKQIKRFKLTLMTLIISFMCASAWATVSFVNTQENLQNGQLASDVQGLENLSTEAKNNRTMVPEPSTLALFGGGFLGMIVSFVRRTYAFAKRSFDLVASTAGFIVLSPMLLLTAILVKLTSKGPIIYSQVRVGKDGESFQIYKFRTMKIDAEKETGPVWAAENDNRLTPVGGFLRKAHLDELPQLFNVLRGEMSVIGPRPERPVFVDKFKETMPNYEQRLMVKPGITGLAQVWHRYDETIADVRKKLRYDLLYIKKMCFWADINIILRTFRVVVTGEGAR